jgi:hypothetical protein
VTTAAEFFGDQEILDELVPIYGADVVSFFVPAVMGMLVVRETTASTDEKQHIFRDDLRYAASAVFRWMGDPANVERWLDQIMDDGIDAAQKRYPSVTSFLDGRFDQFFQEISASFHVDSCGFDIPESG